MVQLTCNCSVADVCPQGKTGNMSRCSIPVGNDTTGSRRSSPSQDREKADYKAENNRLEDNLESISDELQAAVTELEELQEEIRKIRDILNYSPKSQVEKIKEVISDN